MGASLGRYIAREIVPCAHQIVTALPGNLGVKPGTLGIHHNVVIGVGVGVDLMGRSEPRSGSSITVKRHHHWQWPAAVSIGQIHVVPPGFLSDCHRASLELCLIRPPEKCRDALNHLLLVTLGIRPIVSAVSGDLDNFETKLLGEHFVGLRIDGHVSLKHHGQHTGPTYGL